MDFDLSPPQQLLRDSARQLLAQTCPLTRVRAGSAVRIKQLAASPDETHRLREMGFCEERKIRLLSSSANVICQVCNARLAISEELAENILVESLPHQHKVA